MGRALPHPPRRATTLDGQVDYHKYQRRDAALALRAPIARTAERNDPLGTFRPNGAAPFPFGTKNTGEDSKGPSAFAACRETDPDARNLRSGTVATPAVGRTYGFEGCPRMEKGL